ncbi:hypothetical protein HID58_063214, partial [Brassica napus]
TMSATNSDSVSTTVMETVNGSHQFTIKGYSLAKGMSPGRYIQSDVFSVNGYDWVIYFYPDGKNPEENSTYVSLFIALASDSSDIRALFELTLMDQSGRGRHKVHSHFDRALEGGPYTLKYKGSMGYKRFLRRTALEASDYLKDDCLIINCTVGVVRARLEGPKQFCIVPPPSNMGQGLKDLLDSELGCDIIFQVGDETYKAHKLILAARSPVFRAQFYGPVGNNSVDRVVIEDIEPSIFKAMLSFIYTDVLPDVHEITGSTSTASFTNMIQHLLAAADLYDLGRLKILCEAFLCEELNVDNVATTLALADQHQFLQLKAFCLKFVASPANLRAVMKSEGFKHLNQSCPSVLPELLNTVAAADKSSTSSGQSSKKRSVSSVLGCDTSATNARQGLNKEKVKHALEDVSNSMEIGNVVKIVLLIIIQEESVLLFQEARPYHNAVTVNGSHQFTIKGYSLAKGMSPGRYIQSDVFSVNGYDWVIYFYPDGKNPEENSTVGRVVIEDMEPSIFQAMLSFIYTDVLPDVHEITGLTSTASFTNMIQHLLAAADLYDFGRLNILCEAFLCEELNVDNVATTLALADQHQFLQFKEFCLKFVASPANLRALMKSEGFKHLNQSCPSVLPELLNTVAAADKSSTSSGQSSKRRSVSSVLGCDTSTTNARKLRRTFGLLKASFGVNLLFVAISSLKSTLCLCFVGRAAVRCKF